MKQAEYSRSQILDTKIALLWQTYISNKAQMKYDLLILYSLLKQVSVLSLPILQPRY